MEAASNEHCALSLSSMFPLSGDEVSPYRKPCREIIPSVHDTLLCSTHARMFNAIHGSCCRSHFGRSVPYARAGTHNQ